MPNYSDLGFGVIANPGGTSLPNLSSVTINGVDYSVTGGATDLGLTSISLSNNTFDGTSTLATVTIRGAVGTAFTLSFNGVDPSNWIGNSALGATTGTIPLSGVSTTTLTIPATTATVNRVAELRATNDGDSTDVVSTGLFRQQNSIGFRINSITLSNLAFTGTGETVTVTVQGNAGAQFNFSFANVTPLGWLTAGSLAATSGTIPPSGSFTTTLAIPGTTTTVNRTAELRAINTADTSNSITTGLFRQMHTSTIADNDLMVSADSVIVGTTATFSTTISAGDEPFTASLFDVNPNSGTPTPLETITAEGAAPQTITFTAIDTTSLSSGDHDYFIRVTDNDNDVVVQMETITGSGSEGVFLTGFNNIFQNPPFRTEYSFLIFNYPFSTRIRFELTVDGSVIESSEFNTISSTVTGFLSYPRSIQRRPRFDSLGSVGDTLTVSWTNIGVSPNVLIATEDMIVQESIPFADVEVSPVNYRMDTDPLSTVTPQWDWSINRTTSGSSFIPEAGVDYVTGDVDTIPVGGATMTDVDTDLNFADGRILSFRESASSLTSGTTYSARAWVSSVSPRTNAVGTIVYGPVTTFTLP